jgi:hypothetical protein
VQYDCLISEGIAGDISFEESCLDMYPSMPYYAFDGTIHDLSKQDARIQFIRKNLGKNIPINPVIVFDNYPFVLDIPLKH